MPERPVWICLNRHNRHLQFTLSAQTRKDDRVIAVRIDGARNSGALATERLCRNDLTTHLREAVEHDLVDGIDGVTRGRSVNAYDALLVTERVGSQFYMVIWASHTAHPKVLNRVANHAKETRTRHFSICCCVKI